MTVVLASPGSITWQRGSIPLSHDDLLWGARMLIGESTTAARARDAEAAAILWTMAQRLARRFDSGNRSLGTFTEMIRGRSVDQPGYSQPIAIQWSRSGWCAPGGARATDPGCSEDRIRRREAISSMSWSQIEARAPGLQKFLYDWAAGRIANPVPRAVHFAVWGSERGTTIPIQVAPRAHPSNWFGADDISARWPENYVRMGGAGSPASTVAAVVGGLLLGAGLAWAVS